MNVSLLVEIGAARFQADIENCGPDALSDACGQMIRLVQQIVTTEDIRSAASMVPVIVEGDEPDGDDSDRD